MIHPTNKFGMDFENPNTQLNRDLQNSFSELNRDLDNQFSDIYRQKNDTFAYLNYNNLPKKYRKRYGKNGSNDIYVPKISKYQKSNNYKNIIEKHNKIMRITWLTVIIIVLIFLCICIPILFP